MDFFADSTFLVGRWRKGRSGPEQAFIDRHPDAMVGIPWVVKGEFRRVPDLKVVDYREEGPAA